MERKVGKYRVPSIKSRLIKATIKAISPLMTGKDVSIQRKQLESLSALRKTPEELCVQPLDLGMIQAEWIEPPECPNQPVILYLHGGAYVAGSLRSGRVLACELACELQRRVLSVAYRLAPEHPFPAALEDAVSAYRFLLETGCNPKDIVFVGESAGGGLCLCAALKLREEHQPLPAALVCLSPWMDLTCTTHAHRTNRHRDPVLDTKALRESARQYAGDEDLQNPFISPLFGTFEGLPPTLLQAGEDEILYGDSQTVYEKMIASGVDAVFGSYAGMWHVWHVYNIPEARQAMEQIQQFFQNRDIIKTGG